MQKITRLLSLVVLLLVILTVAVTAAGDSAYSTANDPLVSKSYVDSMKAEIVKELAASLDADTFNEYMKTSSFSVQALKKGQRLVATGSCEMVLRSGAGYVIITSQGNIANGVGFSDLTGGAEVVNGKSAPKNHLLLASAGDGRLIEVTSDTAYFMVRGEYTVVG